MPDDCALFAGLDVSGVRMTTWRDHDDPAQGGRLWTAAGADGVHWASDGVERIAALPARMFRFFRNGVANRRAHLLNRYCQGLVPIPPGALCINFGANIGEAAITLAEAGASVVAIEPDPNVIAALKANAAGRSIEAVPVAAWSSDGLLQMYLNSDSADTSAFNVTERPVMVEARRIDTLIAERGIGRVHLIIGDAEGAEPEVLEGARETLKATRYVSLCASAERCGERTQEACEAILTAAGFAIIHREDSGFCTLIAKARD